MRLVSIAGFVLIVTCLVVLEFAARLRPDRLVPLDTLLDEVMATRVARVTVIVFWWWLGWHFLVAQTVDT